MRVPEQLSPGIFCACCGQRPNGVPCGSYNNALEWRCRALLRGCFPPPLGARPLPPPPIQGLWPEEGKADVSAFQGDLRKPPLQREARCFHRWSGTNGARKARFTCPPRCATLLKLRACSSSFLRCYLFAFSCPLRLPSQAPQILIFDPPPPPPPRRKKKCTVPCSLLTLQLISGKLRPSRIG
jgi:hypothetical protein